MKKNTLFSKDDRFESYDGDRETSFPSLKDLHEKVTETVKKVISDIYPAPGQWVSINYRYDLKIVFSENQTYEFKTSGGYSVYMRKGNYEFSATIGKNSLGVRDICGGREDLLEKLEQDLVKTLLFLYYKETGRDFRELQVYYKSTVEEVMNPVRP